MSDQYALAVARIVVAKLADGSGFDALQTSSASILSELLVRYMEEVGVSSHAYTELAGRTEPSAMDVVSGSMGSIMLHGGRSCPGG